MGSAAGKTANWLFVFVAVCAILLAVLLVVARLGLPWLGNYKGVLEANLTERMRAPVAIDDLSIHWEHFGPQLSATGVSLIESADRQVSLDEVLIDLDVLKSFSEGSPVIDELTLIGAKLALETSEAGQFQLHGLAQSSSSSATPEQSLDVLAWLMDTRRVELRGATIAWVNAVDNAQLTLRNLNIVAVNDGDLHQLRVDMQLPPILGGFVEMGLDMIGSSDDIRNASATVHVNAADLKVDAWRSLQAIQLEGLRRSTTGIARLDANVQLELWGNMVAGRLQSARGQLSANDLVDLSSQETVLDRITTDVVFENQPSGWKISTDALEFQNGADLTAVDSVEYRFKPNQNTAWQLDANGAVLELDVATTLVLSLFDKDADLPRGRWLAEAKPKGELYAWDASFGLVDGKPDFSLSSTFEQLELNSVDGIPGVKHIAGTIDMQRNIGKITMQGVDTELDLPAAYASPLTLHKLDVELDVDMQDPLHTSLKGDIKIDDNGFTANTRLEVKSVPGASPHVYTQGKFSLDDVSQATAYIPVRLLKPKTTRWLNQALVTGEAINGELLMFGHVADYPFTENEGVFKIGFDIKDGTLDYLTGWPKATALQGRFDMDGASLRGSASDGRIDSMRLSHLDWRIDDLFKPVLHVSSTSAGSLPRLVEFANTGPLKRILSPALSDVSATGRAQMDLNFSLPLKRQAALNTVASAQASKSKPFTLPGLKVNGSVFLRNSDLTFGRAKLELNEVSGAVGFTKRGIRIDNLQALMNGRPVRIDGKTEGKGAARATEITVVGPIRASSLLENYNIPLSGFVDGESHWNVNVRLPMRSAGNRDGIKVAAVSSLVGTRLMLPEPLGKPVGTAVRMALSSTLNADGSGGEWLLDYGDTMRALVRVDNTGLQSLSARFGGGAPNPGVDTGIRLDGTINALELDSWTQTIAAFIDELPASASPKPILPISTELRVSQFVAGNESVGGGLLRFNTDATYVNGVINSQWLSGSVRYPRTYWKKKEPVIVRLTNIDKRFIDALGKGGQTGNANELDPRLLPPIEARIAVAKWDLLEVKDLAIRTSPTVAGLNIDTFGFAYQAAQLIGNGYWRLRDPQRVNNALADQHVTKLNLTLQGDDYGSLLSYIGFGGTLNEGEGVIAGSLLWPAPAYKPTLESMVGEMDIDLRKGRILKVDPGAARLAGIFALQTIPRRLSLDFKDLVLDGLDYETIRGTVQLANGIAYAPLVQLNGSVGVLDITGESNLITQQYNQRLTVLPRVSSALPVIGIITGGATAGIGALFAGGFLKAIGLDFDRIGLREYTLTGSWDAPEFTLVPFELPAQ